MLVCVFFLLFAHGTAGAACIRHSPRPLISRRESFLAKLGRIAPREGGLLSIIVIASAAKQSILPLCGSMDCFASLAMTAGASRRLRGFQPEPRLDRFAHQEFLDLAGDGHRKFVDEFDVTRDLV